MALARGSHRTRPCTYWKFEDMWSRSDPTYVYPLEGIFDVLIHRKHQLVTLDARSLVVDVADYDEGAVWSHFVPVPLAFLRRPKLLQASVEATLTELNVEPTSTQDIALGVLSYVYDVVGGYVKKFYVGVNLEITTVEFQQELDLRLLLQEMQHHLRAAAVPVLLEEAGGASREAVEQLNAENFSAPKDANLGSCVICLEDLSRGEDDEKRLIKMPCGHLFHDSCIVTWLERSRGCPVCRRELSCG